MTTTLVITETGSRYRIHEDVAGTFWLSGENVPNPQSRAIGPEEWEIERPQPWPPEIGQRLWMPSAYFNAPKDHPGRIPGGGKLTSQVQRIEEL